MKQKLPYLLEKKCLWFRDQMETPGLGLETLVSGHEKKKEKRRSQRVHAGLFLSLQKSKQGGNSGRLIFHPQPCAAVSRQQLCK